MTVRLTPEAIMGQDSTNVGQQRRAAIGVFDSGVGGLTVVRALRKALPGEDVIYLGDTARVPYGSKSPRTVEKYSLGCQQFLLARGVKLVLIACNTASANALPALVEASPVPVIVFVRRTLCLVGANDAAVQLYRYDRPALLGGPFFLLLLRRSGPASGEGAGYGARDV